MCKIRVQKILNQSRLIRNDDILCDTFVKDRSNKVPLVNMLDQNFCIDSISLSTHSGLLELNDNEGIKIRTLSGVIDSEADRKVVQNLEDLTKKTVQLEGTYENMQDLKPGLAAIFTDVPIRAHIDEGKNIYPK